MEALGTVWTAGVSGHVLHRQRQRWRIAELGCNCRDAGRLSIFYCCPRFSASTVTSGCMSWLSSEAYDQMEASLPASSSSPLASMPTSSGKACSGGGCGGPVAAASAVCGAAGGRATDVVEARSSDEDLDGPSALAGSPRERLGGCVADGRRRDVFDLHQLCRRHLTPLSGVQGGRMQRRPRHLCWLTAPPNSARIFSGVPASHHCSHWVGGRLRLGPAAGPINKSYLLMLTGCPKCPVFCLSEGIRFYHLCR